jgi:hypothetical protein
VYEPSSRSLMNGMPFGAQPRISFDQGLRTD